MSFKEHLSFNRRMKELLATPPQKESWFRRLLRKIWALIFLGSLLGCSAKKPVHAPPAPPALNPPKAQLRKGDWILEHCELAKEGTCYCHRPRERLDAKGDKYKVIECR